MGKPPNSEDFENFYLELPLTEYLRDIEIQDEYDSGHDEKRGLSEQQVSQIARDSLEACRPEQAPGKDTTESSQD